MNNNIRMRIKGQFNRMQPAGGPSTQNKRAQIKKCKLAGDSKQKDVKQMGIKQGLSVFFIYLLVFFLPPVSLRPNAGQGLLILEVYR